MVDLLVDEVRHADLGDERLNERLIRIVERFGESPHLSIPTTTTSRAEMEAAYRFFSNSRVSSQKLLAPHAAQTLRRMAEQSVVLMVQDTTEIDLTRPSQPVKGAGPMDCEKRRGEFFHPLMAFGSSGIPLGIVWHKLWAREKIETNATREEKKKRRDEIPIEDKESIRCGSKDFEPLERPQLRARRRPAFVSATANLTFTNCSASHDWNRRPAAKRPLSRLFIFSFVRVRIDALRVVTCWRTFARGHACSKIQST